MPLLFYIVRQLPLVCVTLWIGPYAGRVKSWGGVDVCELPNELFGEELAGIMVDQLSKAAMENCYA